MTGNTSNLQLPYLAVGQAQKHVTVNESLRKLDAIIQLSIVSATTTAQPASPNDGDVWIAPPGKSGAQWDAFADGSLAYFRDGAWVQIAPREGWLAWVKDTDVMLVYTGAAWSTAALRSGLGLGSAATQNTGTSGANVPLLNGTLTWSGSHSFTGSSYLFQASGGATSLTVRGDTGATASYERSGDTTGGPIFNLQKSRGALLSRSNIAANDTLGTFTFSGYADGAFRPGAQIVTSVLTASPGGADMQSEISFLTSGAGSVSPSARMRIRDTAVRPGADNAQSLGDASYRWSEVFAGAGAINTSDAREKAILRPLSDAEKRAAKRILGGVGVFQWLAAVEVKGEGARLHIGVTAQAVEAAFAAEGLDARRYGLFCADAVGEGERLGLRYDQLLALMLAALVA
ncbi:MAG: DUF2793 domain-containing protein [Hyphomonadaceae bacterium]